MGDLERLWDDLPVGRAPVDDILRAGRRGGRARGRAGGRSRRPFRPLLTAGVLTAVGGAFVAGTVVGQPSATGPGGGTPGSDDVVPAAFHGELQPVADCDELLDHYVEQALEIVGPHGWEQGGFPRGVMDLSVARDGVVAGMAESHASAPQAQTSTATSSDTGTNVQEAGVDEPDTVKTDGAILVRIQGAELTTYDLTGEETRELGSLILEDFEDGEILLAGDTVVALGHDGTRDRRDDYLDDPSRPTTTEVVTIDVSSPKEPEVETRVHYDAGLVHARQHGSDVRLVTATGLPALDFVRPSGGRGEQTALEANRELVRETTIADWIPDMSVDGGDAEPVADCEDMAIPRSELGLDTMNVIGFPVDDPADVHTIGLAGDARLAYESADHLYLAASPPTWGGWRPCFEICTFPSRPADAGTTMVFDFELSAEEATYVGSGEVEGSVADRWAMDEHDGVLRLALGPSSETGDFNSVVTLERRDDELVEIGRVDKLGVNEEIKSVRWFDGLAIVVTFRQVDPLYAIDLTDPDAPELLGELKIPGFSEYLHPLGERRLVGVGQGPTGRGWGAQVGLFDVTDLTAPERIATLGYPRASRAMAGADPRQFTWLPAERTVLTVIEQGRTGYVSVLSLDGGEISNRMVEADHGTDVPEIRTVPLPDGRVVLVTGEAVDFLDL